MMQVNADTVQSHTMSGDDATITPDAMDVAAASDIDMADSGGGGNDVEFVHQIESPVMGTAASDSSSSPAIAEDLLNGSSQDTKAELDAEVISEDELPPAPAQPTIDDAEVVSDEELPGPKRAELPADTEVVSEDEFPSSNKVKRKADESHVVDNPNEETDTPKKRAKTELDSEYSHFTHICKSTPSHPFDATNLFPPSYMLAFQTIAEK